MDPSKILGYGAIGLGFLLAYLAYRLLGRGGIRERTIYVYLFFCAFLVVIGALLQYVSARDNIIEATEKIKNITAELDQKSKSLSTTIEDKQKVEAELAKKDALTQAVTNAIPFIDKVQGDLATQNNYAVNDGCSGGPNGIPSNHSADITRLNTAISADVARIRGILASAPGISSSQ